MIAVMQQECRFLTGLHEIAEQKREEKLLLALLLTSLTLPGLARLTRLESLVGLTTKLATSTA